MIQVSQNFYALKNPSLEKFFPRSFFCLGLAAAADIFHSLSQKLIFQKNSFRRIKRRTQKTRAGSGLGLGLGFGLSPTCGLGLGLLLHEPKARARTGLVFVLSPWSIPQALKPGQARPAKTRPHSIEP
jgi:hypothetical protein